MSSELLRHTDFHIFIPSKGRSHRQYTLERLHPSLRAKTSVVVPSDELKDYQEQKIVEAVDRPFNVQGIHNVWSYIFSVAKGMGVRMFFILDDDLTFFRWKADDDWHLRPVEKDETLEMFNRFLKAEEDGYVHGALTTRQGNNNTFPDKFKEVGRANAFHFFNTETMEKLEIDPSVTGLHDIHVTLSLLEKGYPNFILNEFCWNQVKGSGAPGGCSTYRDEEWQKNEVFKLHRNHPDVVKIVRKKPKQGWGNMKERTDVHVRWKKAFDSTRNK